DTRTAGEAVSKIIAARIIPSTMEIMDKATINCVEDFSSIGLPREMAALLLIDVDGHPAMVAEEADGVQRVLEEVGAAEVHLARDAEHAGQLAAARRTALSALARVSPTTLLEDATVPRSKLAETFDLIEALTEKYKLQVGTFGHAGDGNLHPTVLCDERDEDEMERAHAFYEELYEQVLEWGGTVSGEHGIGMAKMGYLKRQIGAGGVAVLRRIKQSFDPAGLLNPGKMFATNGAEAKGE
nr:glycolate oxidase subunit GlcD [Desulfuromonadales bacterium]